MTKTMHLRWLRLKRQTRLSGPPAAQRRTAPWATLPIFHEVRFREVRRPFPVGVSVAPEVVQ